MSNDTDYGVLLAALHESEGAHSHDTEAESPTAVYGLQRRLPGDCARWRTVVPFREAQASYVRLVARLLSGLYPPIALRVVELSFPHRVIGVWDGRAWVAVNHRSSEHQAA